MTIGFTLNQDTTDQSTEAEKVEPKAVTPVAEAPVNLTPNSAFYFLHLEFKPKIGVLDEPGVAENVQRGLLFQHPMAIIGFTPKSGILMTPIQNDGWKTVSPIINSLEKEHQLEVLTFRIETLAPQVTNPGDPSAKPIVKIAPVG